MYTTLANCDVAMAEALDLFWADLHAPAPRGAGISVWAAEDLQDAVHLPLLPAHLPAAYEATSSVAWDLGFRVGVAAGGLAIMDSSSATVDAIFAVAQLDRWTSGFAPPMRLLWQPTTQSHPHQEAGFKWQPPNHQHDCCWLAATRGQFSAARIGSWIQRHLGHPVYTTYRENLYLGLARTFFSIYSILLERE